MKKDRRKCNRMEGDGRTWEKVVKYEERSKKMKKRDEASERKRVNA